MKQVMAVYDVDPSYADRFAEVINQREKIPFTVMAFPSLEDLRSYAQEHPVELLLINSSVSREAVEGIGARYVVALADGETVQADWEYPTVYKYQSSDNIIREVMVSYCEREVDAKLPELAARAQVIGVYSPIGRCLKTSFALTLGQLLAKETKTLYLNLEEFTGLSCLTQTQYQSDLSDLMYYYSQGTYSTLRLNSMIHSIGDLDYIPPARYPEDLAQVKTEKMSELISRIAAESVYEMVILDVGTFGRNVIPLLKICQAVYMPVKEDGISAAKLEEFFLLLETSGHGGLMEHIHKLKLPYHSSFGRRENYLEELLWGELGDYVRQLLRGGLLR